MSKTLNVNYEGKHCYNIEIRPDFNDFLSCFESLDFGGNKICIVTDSNVGPLYEAKLRKILSGANESIFVTSYTIKAGEESKNLDIINKIYEHLIKNHFDRSDMLIALGGGVIGDMTGFTAATYLRGIDFIQVPTSLLSQVDSSIGGKTGVDFNKYKNMVGAFYMPRLVYINLEVIKTLPYEQLTSGMGEVIKHGLIKDNEYYAWLKENSNQVKALDYDSLEHMIYVSCRIKRDVVERDPKEKGERALLNFGHTIGHAIEKCADFSLYHGHCVGVGSIAAAYLSSKYGKLSSNDYEDIIQTFKLYDIPVSALDKSMIDKVYETSLSDKKKKGNRIKFILLNSIGDAYIEINLGKEQIVEGIEKVLK
ncbi:MAG: 3-dehydroquinate synthase [Lachnospiraceae bacterium]|nr:3-dehydroquinate synthase [Lachnospiraceae bacterium]